MSTQTKIFDHELPFGPLFAQQWAEWIKYRTERKLPKYKPMGLKMALNRIVRESGNNEAEAMDMLTYSMEMNYQGIFKRKQNATHQRTTESPNRVGTSEARIQALAKW